jgi:hypothetical protein
LTVNYSKILNFYLFLKILVGFSTVREEEQEEENLIKNSANDWHPLSYCKQSCLRNSRGVQLAYQDCNSK